MQFEGKGGAALRCLDIVRCDQESLQARHGLLRRALGISDEQFGSVIQRDGSCAPGGLIGRQLNAQREFHPNGQWVVTENAKVDP